MLGQREVADRFAKAREGEVDESSRRPEGGSTGGFGSLRALRKTNRLVPTTRFDSYESIEFTESIGESEETRKR